MKPLLDDQDGAIILDRMKALDSRDGPRVGDFVDFSDGTTRRVSYIWRDENGDEISPGVQTSDGGRYYLGDGYVSMSGSLHPGVPLDALTATTESRVGSAWIFHHDHRTASGGVDFTIHFRVFQCDQEPPR